MLITSPFYKVNLIWSSAYTLTETLEVIDRIQICGAFVISDLEEWITANKSNATGWNLGTQVTQLLALLAPLRQVTVLDETKDFMDWDRVTNAWESFHPTGDQRVTVTKYGESRFTSIRFDILVGKKTVSVYLQVIQLPDVYIKGTP